MNGKAAAGGGMGMVAKVLKEPLKYAN